MKTKRTKEKAEECGCGHLSGKFSLPAEINAGEPGGRLGRPKRRGGSGTSGPQMFLEPKGKNVGNERLAPLGELHVSHLCFR